jgi:TRAP-type C4-dicarboxylate transport system permease small subunit
MEYMYLVFPIGLGLMAVNMLRDAAAHLAAASTDPPAPEQAGEAPPDLLAHPE